MRYFVGCTGWRSAAREQGFYPAPADPKEYLSYYSRVFDFVEVGLPATYRFSLARWARETPEGFRFAIRMPRQALDDGTLGHFLESLKDVEEKVLAVVLQTPPGTDLTDGKEWLEKTLGACTYHGYSAVVEFSHPSWFQDAGYSILRRHGAALCWDAGKRGTPHAEVTADTIYLRLGGDRWHEWVEKAAREALDDRRIEAVAIAAPAPALANAALKALGMSEKKYSGPLPAPAPVLSEGPWTGRMVACVDLNAFYPSCEELREPSLAGRPHAVIMTDQPAGSITRGVVSSCSYSARKYGVRSAMPLSRALALCPDLVLRPVDMGYYKQVSEKVMSVISQLADVIEQASIDEAYLDCTKKAEGSGPRQYALKIKRAVREQCGLLCSVGVAPSKSCAKVASDFRKPDGTTVVHPERVHDFLAPLEVGRISGIGPKTQQELKRMGIETVGQLASCDVQKLVSRFGRNGAWMWKVATGADDAPVVPRDDYVSISTEHSLELYAKSRDEVVTHLNGLIDEVYRRVAKRGYLFRTVGVKVVRSDFSIETREVSFQSPQSQRESIASAIPQLADRFSFAGRPIRKVGLKVTNLVPARTLEAQRTIMDFVPG
ncbi:DNA polymerase IV [Nitrososphaera sp.]|uniref:DNA polymerase IV n=1 Tax=Nitrososphaera sp. TaxID=1971748 RepID=UPI001812F15D|nr:DNA polymerase IV [Nitrososphaera sp.]NWG37326.1 DNA polymerase IV [Nitrososphaera sp.]